MKRFLVLAFVLAAELAGCYAGVGGCGPRGYHHGHGYARGPGCGCGCG